MRTSAERSAKLQLTVVLLGWNEVIYWYTHSLEIWCTFEKPKTLQI